MGRGLVPRRGLGSLADALWVLGPKGGKGIWLSPVLSPGHPLAFGDVLGTPSGSSTVSLSVELFLCHPVGEVWLKTSLPGCGGGRVGGAFSQNPGLG